MKHHKPGVSTQKTKHEIHTCTDTPRTCRLRQMGVRRFHLRHSTPSCASDFSCAADPRSLPPAPTPFREPFRIRSRIRYERKTGKEVAERPKANESELFRRRRWRSAWGLIRSTRVTTCGRSEMILGTEMRTISFPLHSWRIFKFPPLRMMQPTFWDI